MHQHQFLSFFGRPFLFIFINNTFCLSSQLFVFTVQAQTMHQHQFLSFFGKPFMNYTFCLSQLFVFTVQAQTMHLHQFLFFFGKLFLFVFMKNTFRHNCLFLLSKPKQCTNINSYRFLENLSCLFS